MWNLEPQGRKTARVEVSVVKAPEALRSNALVIRRYLIDRAHGNCFAAPDASGGLEMVAEQKMDGSAEFHLSAELEPMALCLWQIEQALAERQSPR